MNIADLLFQLLFSEGDVFTWAVTNIQAVMSNLSIPQIKELVVYPGCQLRCDQTTTPTTLALNVNTLTIQSAMTTNTLITLLACLQVQNLVLDPGCYLTCDQTTTPTTRAVHVNTMTIESSLHVNTLVAFLSLVHVDNLNFSGGCHVRGLQNDNPPQLPVSYRVWFNQIDRHVF